MNLKKTPKSKSLKKDDFEEQNIDDILFTFLGRLDEEKKKNEEKRKQKFLDLLAKLGEKEAPRFLKAIAETKSKQTTTDFDTPTVGEALQTFISIQREDVKRLSKKLQTTVKTFNQLLSEPYRISENTIRDVTNSIKIRYNIGNELEFRNILVTGLRYIHFKNVPSKGTVRLAARKK